MSLHYISEKELNNFLETLGSLNLSMEDSGKLGIALGKLLGQEVTHLCFSSKEIEGGLKCHQTKKELKIYT